MSATPHASQLASQLASLVAELQLEPHPEGGFYREIYRSATTVHTPNGPRAASTAIYFALGQHDISRFHRLLNDEFWMWHAGGSATIHIIDASGAYRELVIGPDGDRTVLIPANVWFGATVNDNNGFLLITAVVAPGFDFVDFELADRATMLQQFPEHQAVIERLLP